MGYLHIHNLYSDHLILMFKECYAMEKIHGTSSHISFKDGKLNFFAGGCKFQNFIALFNIEDLTQKFIELGHPEVVVFGEAYGGKLQGMSHTYGPNLKFIAFEVKIGDTWLNVERAHNVCQKLGLEFVDYNKIPCTIESIDAERDKPSTQAIRNGIIEPKRREGIVLRPIEEFTTNNGGRVISKHKNDEFRETKTKRVVSEEQLIVLSKADEIADEWVTEMRLNHVLDKFIDADTKDIPKIMESMYQDIIREAEGEIIKSKDLKKSIYTKTSKMFMKRLKESLKDN